MHQDVFKQLSFSSTAQWKAVVKSIPPKEYGYLEFHANSLAGLILVPPDELADRFEQAQKMVEDADISVTDNWDLALPYIEEFIANIFEVSPAVTHRRLEFDRLIPTDR